MPGNGNPDDLLKQLFGDVVFSYTDAQAIEDGILIPFVANGRDTRHRITNNAYTELKEYYRGKGYSDYDEKQFYYFFFNELLPLVPASFREWRAGEILTTNYDFRVEKYDSNKRQLWYEPNEVGGITLMLPEDH